MSPAPLSMLLISSVQKDSEIKDWEVFCLKSQILTFS